MFGKIKNSPAIVKIIFAFSFIIAMVVVSYVYLIYSYQQGSLADTQTFAATVIALVIVVATTLAFLVIADLRRINTAMEKERETKERLARENEEGAEKEREAMSRQIQIYDAGPIPSSLWSLDFKPIDCNLAMVELLGMSGKEDFMNRFADFNPEMQPGGRTTPEMVVYVITEVAEKGICRYDYLFLSASGELIPGECVAKRIDLKDGSFLSVHFQDIRQRLAAEEKERELRERVQAEQQRMAISEESNKAKSMFLARMSHEIRTPISAILGISEIGLQTPGIPYSAENSFSKIYSSGKLLLGIINDILDFSKIEGGKMEILPVQYDTASLINNATNLHYAYMSDKNIEFNLHVDESLPVSLVGDTLRIEQTIINILSNAFKYTDSGSVNFSLRCRPLNTEKITLAISVSDTGLGMTKEQLAMLFDDYTRFHEQEKSSVSGTGLGMSITTKLVHMMDGTIDVESEVGVGTTVTIAIPQEIASTNVLGEEEAARLQRFKTNLDKIEKRRTFVPCPMPYGSILVVDDIEPNLYVAQGLLAFYSLNVETCKSGQEAIDKIKQGKIYDIVFMDHMMPGLSGPKTMAILREMGYTRPIVALTANALVGQEEEYIKSGFDSFLSKPIMTEKLDEILIKYVKDKQSPEVIEAVTRDAQTKQKAVDSPQSRGNFLDDVYVFGRLRTDFVKNYGNTVAEISQALDTGNTETAQILAHTLKGLAALIRENTLAQIAGQIEKMLAKGEKPETEQLSALEKEFRRVLADIGEPAPVNKGEALDKERSLALLDKIEPLLVYQNAGCINYLDTLCGVPESDELYGQIEEFNFTTALESLEKLRNALKK